MKTRYPTAFVLNVIAPDRPGIVAAVSKAVNAFDGNVDSCSQTVLAGYFTLIMVLSFPQPVEPEQLNDAITGLAVDPSELGIHICRYTDQSPGAKWMEGENFVITVSGADRDGIVLRFADYLADKGININDLYGMTQGDQFILVGQVSIPGRCDVRSLQADLEQLAKEIGHTIRLQHENIFVAINQLRLPHAGGKTAR